MREIAIKRIEELSKEAAALHKQREEMYNTIEQTNIRLHQIVGAIRELDQLVKEEK